MTDILAIAAHPDDVELICSGTLLKTADRGGSFAICDLTRGERGTRGSADLRRQETERANLVLGIDDDRRWNVGIPDGDVRITKENVEKVVRAIRHFRPKILLFPWERDRHPDHQNAHMLVREAYFDAGLTAVETVHDGRAQQPHRPQAMYCFYHSWEDHPDLIVDVGDQMERKLQAIAAYSSQFTVPGINARDENDGQPETFISSESFMEFIIARMRHWGFLIGARYGEAYSSIANPIRVNDLRDLL